MRTEEDLRRMLEDLAAGGTGVRVTLDRAVAVSRRRRRIRLAGTAAASAVLVAVAITVPTALIRGPGSGTVTPAGAAGRTAAPQPAPSAPQSRPGNVLRFTFTVGPVTGYEFVPAEIIAGRQTWMDLSRNPPNGAEVVVYAPGRFDPATIRRDGTPIEVNGHPGYFGSAVDTDIVGGGKRVSRADPATFWQYAPNAWAVVQGAWPRDVGRVEEMKIAKAVRFGAGAAFRVPYRIGWLPDGLEVAGLTRGFYYVGGWDLALRVIDTTSRANPPAELSIMVAPLPPAEARGPHLSAPGPDDRFRVERGAAFSTAVVRGGEALRIDFYPSPGEQRYPEAVQRRILDSITWAPSLSDMDTWFDTGAAVPRR